MLHCIARFLDPLLRLLWPSPGRHRAQVVSLAPTPALTAFPPTPTRPPALRRPPEPCFQGEDSPLVRPYLVAHERRAETRRQRARRRALWLAVHGIDIGPRLIHGMEMTA